MFTRASRIRFACRAASFAIIISVGAWGATSAAAGVVDHKNPKPLSLTNVTIGGGSSPLYSIQFIGMDQGFFKQEGLNVTYDSITSSSSDLIAAQVSGAVQFTVAPGTTMATAAQAGAPLRLIALQSYDSSQEVAINAATAAAHNIPASGNGTQAGALRQFLALKASHLTIAVTNSGSDSYNWILKEAQLHGMTVGTGGTASGDFRLITTGTNSALVAALSSGKADGIVNTPPVTVQPNTIEIQLYKLAPFTTDDVGFLGTSTTLINQHPDTVQAFAIADAKSMLFAQHHPTAALKDVSIQFASLGGITSPEEDEYLFTLENTFFKTPIMTRVGWADDVNIWNSAQPSAAITIPYSTVMVPKFILEATKILGAKWER